MKPAKPEEILFDKPIVKVASIASPIKPQMILTFLETRDAMGFRALDNLDAFFAGKEPNDRLV